MGGIPENKKTLVFIMILVINFINTKEFQKINVQEYVTEMSLSLNNFY